MVNFNFTYTNTRSMSYRPGIPHSPNPFPSLRHFRILRKMPNSVITRKRQLYNKKH